MLRTTTQNRRLHQLLSALGINEDTKMSLVHDFTQGRTASSAEMLYNECANLIGTLEIEWRKTKQQKAAESKYQAVENGLRSTVFSLMYQLGYIDNAETTKRKIYVINGWIKKKMGSDKTLNELGIDELNRLITQLQTVNRTYNERAEKLSNLN